MKYQSLTSSLTFINIFHKYYYSKKVWLKFVHTLILHIQHVRHYWNEFVIFRELFFINKHSYLISHVTTSMTIDYMIRLFYSRIQLMAYSFEMLVWGSKKHKLPFLVCCHDTVFGVEEKKSARKKTTTVMRVESKYLILEYMGNLKF